MDAAKTIPAEPGTVIDVQSVVIEYDAQTAQAVGLVWVASLLTKLLRKHTAP